MIVSASYRTDIPAFYGDWFMSRLRAGYCRVINPRGGQPSTVPLDPESVSGFVFWTRNVGPFLGHLAEVRRLGYPFVVQYTITGYPRALEEAVRPAATMVELARRVAGEFGPSALVWRYDPVVFSSLTPAESHLARFERLARGLEGAADEVVTSFAHVYRKTRRNLDAAAARARFTWWDEPKEGKRALAARLAAIAEGHGMRLTLCSQPEYQVAPSGIARCIDADRLGRVAGRAIGARERGNRPGCACHESRDIGVYDTCPQGCVYCYAVSTRAAAQERRRAHDPGDAFLLPPGRRTGGRVNA